MGSRAGDRATSCGSKPGAAPHDQGVLSSVAAVFERFERVVRCADGHLFTTIWVPMASLKAVRLRGRRWQRCPVGGHWVTVRPVEQGSLSAQELEAARKVHDTRVP